MSDKKKTVGFLRKAFLVFFILALVAVEICFNLIGEPTQTETDLYNTAVRFIGGAVCIIFMLEFSFGSVMAPLGNKKGIALLAVLPAFAIAINNFPFVSFLAGDCAMSASALDIALYAAFCISVGFFEEMAFRGCILMFLLKKRTQNKGGIFMAIFLSSVAFGLIHLVNLFTASPGAVLLQIGYSALIGALCSLVLLMTKNIWLCVVLHSVYNFAGGVVPRFGSGTIWTVPEVALTAVLAVVVASYSFWLFFKMPVSNASKLYEKNED